jgi:4-carboxymuconolactone decarboxylase
MPPIPVEQMTPAQREVAQEMIAGPRGAVIGPFVPALRSPEFTRRLQKVGEYLRYEPALPPRLREMAILLVAREWTQQFEWDAHAPIAEAVGLPRGIVDAIAAGRRPTPMPPEEALLYGFYLELQRTRAMTDTTYAEAVAAFGEQGVIDLVGILGYYTTLAMIMNVARTPPADGTTPALRPLIRPLER